MSEQERSELFEAQRQRIREQYMRPADERPASSARGLHHTALVSSDVEQTVRFYQDLLEFPLTELIENRDYPGSSHFFFDIGNDNLLAFFDFPGLDQGPYKEVLGGLHHLAISVERSRWERLRDKLTAAGVEFAEHSGVSLYFRDPDGARIELIADPLGEMYGSQVLFARQIGSARTRLNTLSNSAAGSSAIPFARQATCISGRTSTQPSSPTSRARAQSS